jgi:hypothetical protein
LLISPLNIHSIFDEYMVKQNIKLVHQNKKILIFIDNAPVHSFNLSNVNMKFFPPNSISKCQPCGLVLINSLKSKYRQILSIKRIQAIKNKKMFHFTLLDCLHYLQEAWEAVSEPTIRNCFRKAGFIHDLANLENTIEEEGPLDDEPIIEEEEEEHEDNDLPICAEDAYRIELNKEKNIESKSDSDSEHESRVTSEKAYKGFCSLKNFMAQNDSEKYKLMHEIEDDLHKIIQTSKTQSLITDFWK